MNTLDSQAVSNINVSGTRSNQGRSRTHVTQPSADTIRIWQIKDPKNRGPKGSPAGGKKGQKNNKSSKRTITRSSAQSKSISEQFRQAMEENQGEVDALREMVDEMREPEGEVSKDEEPAQKVQQETMGGTKIHDSGDHRPNDILYKYLGGPVNVNMGETDIPQRLEISWISSTEDILVNTISNRSAKTVSQIPRNIAVWLTIANAIVTIWRHTVVPIWTFWSDAMKPVFTPKLLVSSPENTLQITQTPDMQCNWRPILGRTMVVLGLFYIYRALARIGRGEHGEEQPQKLAAMLGYIDNIVTIADIVYAFTTGNVLDSLLWTLKLYLQTLAGQGCAFALNKLADSTLCKHVYTAGTDLARDDVNLDQIDLRTDNERSSDLYHTQPLYKTWSYQQKLGFRIDTGFFQYEKFYNFGAPINLVVSSELLAQLSTVSNHNIESTPAIAATRITSYLRGYSGVNIDRMDLLNIDNLGVRRVKYDTAALSYAFHMSTIQRLARAPFPEPLRQLH
jgi:hypothetical protein